MSARGTVSKTEAPKLTPLNGRVWSSWHLYEVSPNDYLRVISIVVLPVVKELSAILLVDRFFFIRYVDEGGYHVRLRFRFPDDSCDTVDHVAGVMKRMAAECGLTVLPRPFELEAERYGGLDYLPLSLELFCLSSVAALDWFERHAEEPRSRQLPALMGLLTSQAVASARSLDELMMLLDYFAAWRARMESPIQHGNRIFESQSEKLISLLRLHIEATLSASAPQGALIEGARALSTATLTVVPKARNEILLSQMHMTANRLGLRNAEESYVTQILQRALNKLIQEDLSYARELDARLARQQSTARLDMLVSRCLETQ
jgi:thiopeptide-type bacteriocin biosynthesis protein